MLPSGVTVVIGLTQSWGAIKQPIKPEVLLVFFQNITTTV